MSVDASSMRPSQRLAISSECPALDHLESANSAMHPAYVFGGPKASLAAGSTSSPPSHADVVRLLADSQDLLSIRRHPACGRASHSVQHGSPVGDPHVPRERFEGRGIVLPMPLW